VRGIEPSGCGDQGDGSISRNRVKWPFTHPGIPDSAAGIDCQYPMDAPQAPKEMRWQGSYRVIKIRFNHIEKGERIMKRKMLIGVLVLVGLF